jgi:NAD(P)-dependent dehydrogenase (short-subunit alcohol dehydrogenase family)
MGASLKNRKRRTLLCSHGLSHPFEKAKRLGAGFDSEGEKVAEEGGGYLMIDKWRSFGLKDQVAIVTGASQGIGRSLALALAEAGVQVALVSRNGSALEQAAAEIEALGARALITAADLRDLSKIRSTVDQVHQAFGKIDILINNAAWTATVDALDVTEEEWDQTMDTSLKAMFFLSQAAAKKMVPRGRGKMVNIGSTFGQVVFKGRSVYAAAKAGVHHLTRALAYEWAPMGIHVNAVAPCITETLTRQDLFERPGYKEWVTGEMLPIRRWAQPEDFVGATLFLCSSLSDMVVGHVLMVDGGWTIH